MNSDKVRHMDEQPSETTVTKVNTGLQHISTKVQGLMKENVTGLEFSLVNELLFHQVFICLLFSLNSA